MAGTNSISGLSSGFDWASMIDQLIEVEKAPVTLVENQKSAYESQLSAWQSFNTQLLSLKTAAQALSEPDDFNVFTSSMTSGDADVDAEDLLTVSATSDSSVGIYTITINNIATAQKIGSGTFTSGIDALGDGFSGDIIINGKTISISETDGLDDIRNRINNSNAGVTASIIHYSDSDYRLNLTSNTTGADGITLENGSTTNLLQLMGWTDTEGVVNEIVAGGDASILIDGVEVTSEDNMIDDVLTGVTLNLTNEDPSTTITLNIKRDINAIEEKIQTFVDAYNKVSSYINEQQTYDDENETAKGVLFGDGTLSSVKSDLTSLLVQQIWGVSSNFSIIGMAGINLDDDGQLSINSETLKEYLETNFSDIQKLFSSGGTSSSSSIEYIYSTNDTEAGNYVVNITQAATKNSSTGDTAVSGTLGNDQTLTITEGDNTAVISLTSGMTISDIVNAVNTELDTAYTEKLVGDTEVTSSSSPVTSATTWSAIDNANLADGDTISFTGTAKDGSNISGSYTISNTAANTIQGLLAEIESAFENEVSASIDSSGRLVLMDNEEGSSSLSLAFDYSETANPTNDIFGTVLTTNDGGQDGRKSMAITASNDGSNHLQLSNDNYGSGYSFTIQSGLWSSSPVTVNNGQDIAGTINGEAATGSGQRLTGNEDAANIAGLSIRYTGSSTGNVGNIKFTTGVAELFDRALFNITDSFEGYVAFKQDSLSEHISDLEDRMDRMNDRLDKRKETLLARFTAMELALSKIQSMSSWLTGQLEAASTAWK
jgi:flagellar hook-associated protein 2